MKLREVLAAAILAGPGSGVSKPETDTRYTRPTEPNRLPAKEIDQFRTSCVSVALPSITCMVDTAAIRHCGLLTSAFSISSNREAKSMLQFYVIEHTHYFLTCLSI